MYPCVSYGVCCFCMHCRSVYLNIPFLIIMNVLVSLVGLVIYAHFADVGCDPLRSGQIASSNQVCTQHSSLKLSLEPMLESRVLYLVRHSTPWLPHSRDTASGHHLLLLHWFPIIPPPFITALLLPCAVADQITLWILRTWLSLCAHV